MKNYRKKINFELKIGAIIVSMYFIWATLWIVYQYLIAGSFNFPYRPEMSLENELILPFTKSYILGTDMYGRSLFELLSCGLTYSLTISIIISFINSCLGIILGYLIVKTNRWISTILDVFLNIVFIFPSILIAILVMSYTGQSVYGLIFSMIITGWPGFAKISRNETKRILSLSYVESAKAIGISEYRLFFKIFLPELLPIITVNIVLNISGVIISEAALGFLGLGGSPYSWGNLLSNAKTVLLEAPHLSLILSLLMGGLIIGLNLVGDGLRDYLDPKEK